VSQVPSSQRPSSGGDGPGVMGAPRGRRGASVTLRPTVGADGQRAQSVGELMDPANRSLADALKIAYRLLLLAIGVMIVLFAFSGVQQVQVTEVGVREFLGRLETVNLEQGLRFSWPQPIGNILKVPTGDQTVELKEAFFPKLTPEEEKMLGEKGVQGLVAGGRDVLDPDTDGALLTGDGAIVHTRLRVTYRRTDGAQSLKSMSQDVDENAESMERRIVAAAVRRGVVHAAAGMTIDAIVANQAENGRPAFSDAAKAEAQRLLNEMHVGITLQEFAPQKTMPPRYVMQDFNAVQSAESQASEARQKAEGEARQALTKAAGDGAGLILAQIDRYDGLLAAGKTDEAAKTLEDIQTLMRYKRAMIDGKEVAVNITGDVSQMLSDAEQYRTGVVTRAQGDASAFKAKLGSFETNPKVFLTGEWSDAYTTFSRRDNVQIMLLPPGLERLVVQINRDPKIAQMIKEQQDTKEAQEVQELRNQQHTRDALQMGRPEAR